MQFDFQVTLSRAELTRLRTSVTLRKLRLFLLILFLAFLLMIPLAVILPSFLFWVYPELYSEWMADTLTVLLVGMFWGLILVLSALWVARRSMPWLTPKDAAVVLYYHLDEAGLSETRYRCLQQIGWETVSGVRRKGNCLLLVVEPWGLVTFPIDQVPPDARQFIAQQVAAHGGKVS